MSRPTSDATAATEIDSPGWDEFLRCNVRCRGTFKGQRPSVPERFRCRHTNRPEYELLSHRRSTTEIARGLRSAWRCSAGSIIPIGTAHRPNSRSKR